MAEEVVDTPFGKFLVNPAECIGGTIKAGTIWDGPGFLQVIAQEYGEIGECGVTILDVGAHLGDWTIWLAGLGAWRVIAVEPAPYMIQLLKANLDLNKWDRLGYTGAPLKGCADRVILLPIAAYDRYATLTWRIPYVEQDAGGADLVPLAEPYVVAGKGSVVEIPAAPLDAYRDLFGDRVSLIKIDAQGCDGLAIYGLRETIERDRPVIVFEWEERLAGNHAGSPPTLGEITEWLVAHGYSVREWPSHLSNYVAVPTVRRGHARLRD